MKYQPRLAELFIEEYKEAYRTDQSLVSSLSRISSLTPFDPVKIAALDETQKEIIDAFCLRFGKLQDLLWHAIFRALLKLELEDVGSQLDVLNKMEKRRLILSVDEWFIMRSVRNGLMHEYPDNPDTRAEVLNKAMALTPVLVRVLNAVRDYVEQQIGVNMSFFPAIDVELKQ